MIRTAMRLTRLAGVLFVGSLLGSSAAVDAALVDDARNVLSRLGDTGDLGRGAAEGAVRQAREAAERSARDSRDAAMRSLEESKKKLDDLQRRVQAGDANRRAAETYQNAAKGGQITRFEQRPVDQASRDRNIADKQVEYDAARRALGDLEKNMARDGKVTPQERTRIEAARAKLAGLQRELTALKEQEPRADRREDKAAKLDADSKKIEAQVAEAREKYEQAREAAKAELITGIVSGLAAVATGSVNGTVGDIQRRVNDARNALRAVVPQPAGTRPPTRTERRCATVLGRDVCSDVQVANDPPDGELRAAIDAGTAALSDIGRASQTALARFQDAQRNQADLQAAQQRLAQFLVLVSNVEKKVHDIQMATINNMR
jgi:hypothetical protein